MTGPVESKVKWSTLIAYLAIVALLAVLQVVSDDPTMLSGLPDWFEVPLIAVLPTLLVLFAGLRAKHTPRPDLPPGDGKTLGTR